MILYRPVGLKELELIGQAHFTAFPPRLPIQPIFYPVLNFEYVAQIAREWNAQDPVSGFAGFVTKFEVEDKYAKKFDTHVVGSNRIHLELWVSAEELKEFNRHIKGSIKIEAAYYGNEFRGYIPDKFALKGRDAIEQFSWLVGTFDYSTMDFQCEIRANNLAVFLHYAFWMQHDFSREGIFDSEKNKILAFIKDVWLQAFPQVPLPEPAPHAG